MMASYNHCVLLGNLTRDVQLSYTTGQTAVAEFGLAVNRNWTDQGGQRHEKTCFIDVKCFGRQAENCNKYLRKGAAVLVAGELDYDAWEQDGQKRSRHRIMAASVQFLTPLNGTEQER